MGPLALAVYLTLGAAVLWLVAALSQQSLLSHHGEISRQFVQAMLDATNSAEYFDERGVNENRDLQQFLERLLQMPEILQANVYHPEGGILWSSAAPLIGMKYEDNDELDRARAGRVAIERGHVTPDQADEEVKKEHYFLPGGTGEFVEVYMPLYDAERSRIVGVVELYRDGAKLNEALTRNQALLVGSLVAVGLAILLIMNYILTRANRVIERQRDLLVRDSGLVAVGAAGSAIAHNIRNPLSNIRTTAELLFEDCPGQHRPSLESIVADVDRINSWIVGMLEYVRSAGPVRRVDLAACLDASLRMVESPARARGVKVRSDIAGRLPSVLGEPHVVEHVFITVLSNAIEAMPRGGSIDVRARSPDTGNVEVEITDTGPGIPEEVIHHLGAFVATDRPGKLGVGLGLAKRILDVFEGDMELSNRPQGGASVKLRFRVVDPTVKDRGARG